MDEGYTFVAFDPDKSEEGWAVKDGVLYGGLTSVHGVGRVTARKLLEIRAEQGEGWMSKLTPAQRSKLLAPMNTPWHDIGRLGRDHAKLYEEGGGGSKTSRRPRPRASIPRSCGPWRGCGGPGSGIWGSR